MSIKDRANHLARVLYEKSNARISDKYMAKILGGVNLTELHYVTVERDADLFAQHVILRDMDRITVLYGDVAPGFTSDDAIEKWPVVKNGVPAAVVVERVNPWGIMRREISVYAPHAR